MSISDIETTENGNLVNTGDWTEDLATEIAADDGIADLTEKHWDLINYLRDEFTNNNGNQPNERNMVKAMKANGRPQPNRPVSMKNTAVAASRPKPE